MFDLIDSMITLTDEQQAFIDHCLKGENVLVDACIGSGKTTAIQYLCNLLPATSKVLYLTYNRLLKVDAKKRIHNQNVLVTNYHGFASKFLRAEGYKVAVPELVQAFLRIKPSFPIYDILIIDEYQDLDTELADLLLLIKSKNPNMQIIAVGDLEQKIYDKTVLDPSSFIAELLSNHINLNFTNCFRLSEEYASFLGRVWKKNIHGVNSNCSILELSLDELVEYLSDINPSDLLCLGARTGDMASLLNFLELKYPFIYNKQTVYASIRDRDSSSEPKGNSAIFTTFDSAKGLERKICVLFDVTEEYWSTRARNQQQSYEILRNIFCVAMSRGKDQIIFVKTDKTRLSEKTLSHPFNQSLDGEICDISSMFDFKYRECIEEAYSKLCINHIPTSDQSVIPVSVTDGLIDLSPCVGIWQEASFFKQYSIEKQIELFKHIHKNWNIKSEKEIMALSLEEKVLYLVSLDTRQERYATQAKKSFVSDSEKERIFKRLSSTFSENETVQVSCELHFADDKGCPYMHAVGRTDVVKDEIIYELKFVSELSHEHFLQCACYMVALGLQRGILWNIRDNSRYAITIPDEKSFMDSVARAISKNYLKSYVPYMPNSIPIDAEDEECYYAVIDTETNFSDEVISIGVVIAEQNTLREIDCKYYILIPEAERPAMFSSVLEYHHIEAFKGNRYEVFQDLIPFLKKYHITSIYAYNASFDEKHLKELSFLNWFDVMKIAANRFYNHAIPENADCYSTGKLKRNYGVESILKLLNGDPEYREIHNALFDARDELKIMQLLNLPLRRYNDGIIGANKSFSQINGAYDEFLKLYSFSSQENVKNRSSAQDRKEEGSFTNRERKEDYSSNLKNDEKSNSFTEAKDSKEYSKSVQSEPKLVDQSDDKQASLKRKKSTKVGQPDNEIEYYDVPTIAKSSGVAKSRVYYDIRRGRLNAKKRGNKYIIKADDANEYIRKTKQKRWFTILGSLAFAGIMFLILYTMLS